jgi:hypothetical protein
MSFEYMNSKQSIISYKNYSYTLNKISKAVKYYRCAFNNSDAFNNSVCNASLSILDNNIEIDNFNHTHNPLLPIKNEYLLMVSKLKIQIKEQYLNISEVATYYFRH